MSNGLEFEEGRARILLPNFELNRGLTSLLS